MPTNTNTFTEYAKGNPGALTFLVEIQKHAFKNQQEFLDIINKIRSIDTLRGTNLWVLYSDLCKRDMSNVVKLCRKCPENILEDACKRQDYSGRTLIAEYLI